MAQPNIYDGTTALQAAEQLIDYLVTACDSCMPPKGPLESRQKTSSLVVKGLGHTPPIDHQAAQSKPTVCSSA